MELRHLRTFVAVAEELHFRAAAARLYLSPPAVSEHIRTLERELGVAVFDRSRPISLTDAGRVLLGHARETLARADAATVALRDVPAGTVRTLRVGILSNGAGELTPLIVKTFMTEHPGVQVSLHRLNLIDYATALDSDKVDVAFVRPAPDHANLCAIALSKEDRVVVMPADHPMAEAGELPAEDVLDEPFVGLADGVPSLFASYLYLEELRGGTPPRTVASHCADVTDVLAAVAAGRGVASAVESFRGYENWPGVAYAKLLGPDPGVNSLLTRHKDPSPCVAAFVSTVHDVLSSWSIDRSLETLVR